MSEPPDKNKIHEHCLALLNNRFKELRDAINAVQEVANSETKSSAGDKHETSRAMAQRDVEMLSRQLGEISKSIETLKGLKQKNHSDLVQPGSVVVTSIGVFYLSVALGKIEISEKSIMVISSESPFAKAILGRKQGNQVEWKGSLVNLKSVEN